jgi:uncharacterized protein
MTFFDAFLWIAPLAFTTGFCLHKGNICTVLAARQIAETGRYSRLLGFGTAASFSLLAGTVLSWGNPENFAMSRILVPSWITVLAGAGYGVGTFVNGACLFGICSRAVSGSLHFLAAIPGIAAGAAAATASGLPKLLGDASPSPLEGQSMASVIFLCLAGLVAAFVLVEIVISQRRAGFSVRKLLKAKRWRSSLALMFVGICGSAAFVTGEGWSYPVLSRQMWGVVFGNGNSIAPATLVGSIALFSGAFLSRYLSGGTPYSVPTFAHTARSFAGGSIMGFTASLIPGGNDSLILYGIPSLALHAVVAFAAMFATLIVLAKVSRRFKVQKLTAEETVITA